MCGIVGYIGKRKAVPILLEGLKRLEYRGYDSSGVAVATQVQSFPKENKFPTGQAKCKVRPIKSSEAGAKQFNRVKSEKCKKSKIYLCKAVGKIEELEKKLNLKNEGQVGIAHTRWATHGKPSVRNAHPHGDCEGDLFVVHNGIIENHDQLKKILQKKGHLFKSETDTEVLSHLIEEEMKKKDLFEATQSALKKVEGTYGLAVISKKDPEKMIIARKGSPLLFGIGKDEFIVASDASAVINYTRKVVYLNDGEVAEIEKDSYRVVEIGKGNVNKKATQLAWTAERAQKQGYKHFMLKEIHEQPEAIKNAIRGRANRFIKDDSRSILGGLRQIENKLRKINKLVIVSCGTSYYAGLVGEYMIEEYANLPVEVEYASEYRYRKPVIDKRTAILAISQSGETADTLEAIREGKLKGALTLGIVNTVGSTIARETDAGVYNHAGPEIGVASTKAFTSQLSILALLAVSLGRQRQMSLTMGKRIAQELIKIPGLMEKILRKEKEIKRIATKYKKYNDWLYLGRKYNFPIAMEGALKIKEISYVHAEGYATGEMKHGPIALIDKNFPSFFIVPKDSVYEKVVSGMEEIKARGGKIVALATEGDKKIQNIANDVIYIPKTLEMLTPLLSVIPAQLLAYYVGVSRGLDVDKPRNLAKSVTVE